MKTKQVTKSFTRKNHTAGGYTVKLWCNQATNAVVCDRAVQVLWNIPSGVRRIWITAQNFSEPGKTLRIRRDHTGWWDLEAYGLYPTARAALDRFFPNARQVHIAIEYEK